MQKNLIWAAVCAVALTACAADAPPDAAAKPAGAPAEQTDGLRVMVRVAGDTPGALPDENPSAIAARASAAAGVPVRYGAASGAQWHALTLQCQPGDCEQAMQRLAADRIRFPVVQLDEVRRR